MNDVYSKTGKDLITVLRDIAKSLRIMSGREDYVRQVEKPKSSYADKYFSKDK